jgi:hypothetical protein
MFNFRLWAKGLAAGVIGGAATAATTAISDPSALQRPRELGASVGVGALVGGLAYLKTHPPVDAVPEALQPMTAAATTAAANAATTKLTTFTRKP